MIAPFSANLRRLPEGTRQSETTVLDLVPPAGRALRSCLPCNSRLLTFDAIQAAYEVTRS
jgi:hypothetical protein